MNTYDQIGIRVTDLGCCCNPTPLLATVSAPYGPPPDSYDISYNLAWDLSWNAVPGATSYAITVPGSMPYIVITTDPFSATIYIQWDEFTDPVPINITADGSCGTATTQLSAAPCFLAGSPVQMADGSTKPIEEVRVGDAVLGAFGEVNTVLALHRPLLGSQARMCRINGEHSTTNHHPHVSVDRRFYCGDPVTVLNITYGREHDVIDAAGSIVKRMLHGLAPGRIEQLTAGVDLKTVEGSRPVKSLDLYDLPTDTQLYNLVIDGSHTYHVDGYAVTGWPREDDWDYTQWVPKKLPTV